MRHIVIGIFISAAAQMAAAQDNSPGDNVVSPQHIPPLPIVLTFHPIFYYPESAREISISHGPFDRTVAAIERSGDYARQILIFGHTDTVGSKERNYERSAILGQSVGRRLIRRGIEPERIHVFACGEDQLARPTPDDTAEPLNRRVQVEWTDWETIEPTRFSCRSAPIESSAPPSE